MHENEVSKSQPTPIPSKIGKYEILDILGRGGMGIVYRARNPRLGRIVALKTLTEGFSGNPEMLKRFYHEASHTGALRHPNIVVIYDAGDEDGMPYIVMEYVEGEPLDTTLKERTRTPIELRLSIVEQVCTALAYAHRNGVIHRDIKPANVIVQRDGTAKLLDFGIARADQTHVDQSLTSTGTLIGTPAYMAPERLQGAPIDGRSDIFSTGVLLYQLITNRLPFDAEFPAIIQQILHTEPAAPSQLVPGCPPGLDAIVARAIAKSPSDRYAYADDMASDLRSIVETIKHDRVAELMAQAEQLFSERSYLAAQDALRQLAHLDNKHLEGKRLLSLVEQRITQQEKERKAHELTQLAQQAVGEREWDRALEICEQAIQLLPESTTLVELHKSVLQGRKTQREVAQLLVETAAARKAGDLAGARTHAESAYRLDPHNSQILALCKVLEQEIEGKRRKEELRALLASAREAFERQRMEEAAALLADAESISPGDAELIRFRDQLTLAMAKEKQMAVVRRLEEKAALTNTVDKLRAISTEVGNALQEFPTDSGLLRLRLLLEPRIQQLEDEALVREVSRAAKELPPDEALARVREALVRIPGNEQLSTLESALSERAARQARERLLAQYLRQARQAIDDRLYLEAVKILERCQAEGYSSSEIQALLDLAKSAASQRISQELIERTYSQAKQFMQQGDYEAAAHLLRRALRQVDEPVLRRQLEEVTQKQSIAEQRAKETLERVSALMHVELHEEAVRLLEEQPAGVTRLSEVTTAMERIRKLAKSESEFWNRMGRVYAMLGTVEGIPELKVALGNLPETQESTSRIEAQKCLRQRSAEIANEKVVSAIASAREAIGLEDSERAESILREVQPWSDFSSPSQQEELRAMQAELLAAKKVIRFRRALRK
jgi:eukaryotic-like serine/threonine-protein kinase